MSETTRTKPSVIIVDDDPGIRMSFSGYLTEVGYDVSAASSRAETLVLLSSRRFDVLLLDINLPDSTGLECTAELRDKYPDMVIIVITGQADVPVAVEAMRKGADNFLTKPVDMRALHTFLVKSLELGNLRRTRTARQRTAKPHTPYWGESPAMRQVMELARLAAANNSPVLLQGETGTGKGMLARWIHEHGPGAQDTEPGPFVEVNCSTLRGELLASELFGHARGAFTGAVADKEGLIGVADGGTLFLDEIGDMDLSVQSQFLKVLEDKQFRRLGETRQRMSEFRVICASNRDLGKETSSGGFRIDLFFRINVLPITLPPLRERTQDIPGLAAHMLEAITGERRELGADVADLLVSYAWPGNAREMRNVLERATLLAGGGPLAARHFPGLDANAPVTAPGGEPDEAAIMAEVKRTGSVTKAAKSLGMSRATLYRRVKSFRDKAN